MEFFNKKIFFGLIFLICLFQITSVCASDNLTSIDSDILSEEDTSIEFSSSIDEDNIITDENSEDIFVNPDFEEGDIMSHYGWDVNCSDVKPQGHGTTTEYVSIRDGVQDAGVDLFGPGEGNTGYIYENCRVLYIYQIGGGAGYYPVISQNINFDNVDNISFYYCLPYSGNYVDPMTFDEVIAFQSKMQAPQNHTIEIYCDDDLIDSIVIDPKFGWQPITVDTTPYSGYGEFKVKIKWTQIKQAMGNMLYLDNFTVKMAPVPEQVDSIISISSINANNVVSGFLKDISGNPLANAVINYTINNNNDSVVTSADGSFSINGVDNYEIFINYLGNKTIKATSTSIKLDNLTGPLVEAQANASKLADDLADANQKVDNLTTQLSDAQANASKLADDLADANQKISNLTTQLNDAQINPVLVNTNVLVSDLNIKAGESGVLKVTLKDASGIGLANQTINVLINGKNYNAVTGNDGVAQVSLKYDGANTYYANIYYAGNNTYKSSIATGKVVVTKKATTLTAPKKTFKVKAKTKKVAITLKSNGKAVAGKKITIKIKGKTYSAKTNSKGVATIKVKLTKKGTYKYTAKFAGDNTYNTISKKGTIKVKK